MYVCMYVYTGATAFGSCAESLCCSSLSLLQHARAHPITVAACSCTPNHCCSMSAHAYPMYSMHITYSKNNHMAYERVIEKCFWKSQNMLHIWSVVKSAHGALTTAPEDCAARFCWRKKRSLKYWNSRGVTTGSWHCCKLSEHTSKSFKESLPAGEKLYCYQHCVCVCVCVCACVCAWMYVCVYTYVYTYMKMLARWHTRVCINTNNTT